MLPFKIKTAVYCKDTNRHGGSSETVLGWKLNRIPNMRKGYFRLMLYAPSGKCWNLDIYRPKSQDSEPYWSV